MIQTSLMLGAASGAKDVAKSAVNEAYAALKGLLVGLFRGRSSGDLVLAEHEQDPDTWRAPLIKILRETGCDQDPEILAAARNLLDLADPEGSQVGKYIIDARHSTGTTIGDRAMVTHHYGLGTLPIR